VFVFLCLAISDIFGIFSVLSWRTLTGRLKGAAGGEKDRKTGAEVLQQDLVDRLSRLRTIELSCNHDTLLSPTILIAERQGTDPRSNAWPGFDIFLSAQFCSSLLYSIFFYF
jgi:hypothetical protein